MDPTSVLVKPEVASAQVDADQASAGIASNAAQAPSGATAEPVAPTAPAEAVAPRMPTRFYGRVSLDPVRMLRDLGDIADAIVSQLGRADAGIKITVEVEAEADEGFPDEVRRTVSENARTLKFESSEFED
jgi:hypothetical protein